MKESLFYSVGCVLVALLSSCGGDGESELSENPSGAEVLEVQAVRLDYLEEGGKTRALTDHVEAKTSFQPGDAIGVFAIRDGEVLQECKNRKVIMQADGTWKNNYLLNIPGAVYFAYSPYRDVEGIRNAKSVQDIYDNFTVADDQSTAAKYAANDLMTCDNCVPYADQRIILFTFKHELAMVEADAIYGKGKGELYPLYDTPPESTIEVVSGSPILGYVSPKTATSAAKVRALFKPRAVDLRLKFSYLGSLQEFSLATTLEKGVCYRYKPYKTRDAKVGDYYYSDGSIFPKEWTDAGRTPPSIEQGCVGIVFATPDSNSGFDNNDKLNMLTSDQNRGWTNGYVLAVENMWYDISGDYSTGYFCDDLATYLIDDEVWFLAYPTYIGVASDIIHKLGDLYTNTYSGYDQMEEFNANNPIMPTFTTEYIFSYTITTHKYPLHWATGNTLRIKHPLPLSTSGWFPPSAKQAAIAARNLGEVSGGLFNTSADASWLTKSPGDRVLIERMKAKFEKVGGRLYSLLTCSSSDNTDNKAFKPLILNMGIADPIFGTTEYQGGFGFLFMGESSTFYPMFAF